MKQTAVGHETWIRRYHPAPDAAVRLVTLPHAGGAATWYRPFSAALSPAIEVLAVQYPGRQDRRREEVITDIHRLADGVTEALLPYTDDRPFAVFGHSMGATVGFEVVRRLEARGRAPLRFFASGRPAPSLDRDHLVHRLDDAGVLAELRTLSGTDPLLFEDEELLRLMLPVIRGDYRAVETYRGEPDATVGCPVTVLTGDGDPRVSVGGAAAWSRHAPAGAGLHVFPGGHFFLADHREAIAALVRDALLPRP
ncbi:alpha/beta fold hydrolase [Streptomyces sp. E-15]|uniref:thioesterase II family protein n=1 Tax=Streptomyces sp. NRRL S-31 TaxID=1463898 RepID=UPI0004C6D466|nr:alpha/beta fold hydrolase [Streptomyces sp. NRRL S-31]